MSLIVFILLEWHNVYFVAIVQKCSVCILFGKFHLQGAFIRCGMGHFFLLVTIGTMLCLMVSVSECVHMIEIVCVFICWQPQCARTHRNTHWFNKSYISTKEFRFDLRIGIFFFFFVHFISSFWFIVNECIVFIFICSYN